MKDNKRTKLLADENAEINRMMFAHAKEQYENYCAKNPDKNVDLMSFAAGYYVGVVSEMTSEKESKP